MATQNQLNAEYNKELNRLKRFMREARKKGFAFPETAIPKPPKKVTAKSVSRLQKITSESLYKKGTYTIPETGQVVSGLKGQEIIRKAKSPKAPNAGVSKIHSATASVDVKKPRKKKQELDKSRLLKAPRKKTEYVFLGVDPRTGQKVYYNPKNKTTHYWGKSTTGYTYLGVDNEGKPIYYNQATDSSGWWESFDHSHDKLNVPTVAEKQPKAKTPKAPPVAEDKEIPERSYIVLSNFLAMFNRWTPMPSWSEWYAGHRRRYNDIGYNVIVSIIDQNGEDTVSKNLEGHSEDVAQIAEHLLYGSASDEELDEDINRIATILQGKPLSFEQSINATELAEQRGIRTALAEDMNIDFIL